MTKTMQKAIRHILYLNGMAEAFDSSEDFHLRLKNDPWLALVVERHGDEVSITHYVEQNGDLLRDPEIVFSLHQWAALSSGRFQGWVPKSTEPGGPLAMLRAGLGHVYLTGEVRHVGAEPPRLLYYPRRMKEAIHFAAMWARNLRAQSFVRRYARAEIESLTHPAQLAKVLAATEVPIPISHTSEKCADGTELHTYAFPNDLPAKLVPGAYRQAEARLKAEWPTAGRLHPYGVCGNGYRLSTASLPSCSCFG